MSVTDPKAMLNAFCFFASNLLTKCQHNGVLKIIPAYVITSGLNHASSC